MPSSRTTLRQRGWPANTILKEKTHQFIPGTSAEHFLVHHRKVQIIAHGWLHVTQELCSPGTIMSPGKSLPFEFNSGNEVKMLDRHGNSVVRVRTELLTFPAMSVWSLCKGTKSPSPGTAPVRACQERGEEMGSPDTKDFDPGCSLLSPSIFSPILPSSPCQSVLTQGTQCLAEGGCVSI